VETRVAEFGIACEACHGPAEEHLKANRLPTARWARYFGKDGDASIVNPKRQPYDRASDLCGQCHGLSAWDNEGPERNFGVTGYTFRPGDDLDDTRLVVGPSLPPAVLEDLQTFKPDLFTGALWGDGMIRVAGRELNGIVESPCYEPGLRPDGSPRPGFSCLDCHLMHKDPADERSVEEWTDDLLQPGLRGDTGCLQCHEEIADDAAGHTRHEPGGAGSACYDCHMPNTTYGLLKATRSHQVTSPTVAETLDHGRLNACNSCHLDRTLAWTAEQLHAWTGEEVPILSETDQQVPAAAIHLLSGDAGQRALAAWAFGWDHARIASGTEWLAAPLARLLDDPYDAVRIIAWRSLATLDGFEDLGYDPVGPPEHRTSAAMEASARAPLDGPIPAGAIDDLWARRNDARVYLLE
jgi:hypothetical protein